jgi:hypothetical protein
VVCFRYFTSQLGPHVEVVDENECHDEVAFNDKLLKASCNCFYNSVACNRNRRQRDKSFPNSLPLSVSASHAVTMILELFYSVVSSADVTQLP